MSRPTLFWFVSGFYKACAVGYVQCLVTYGFIKVRGWITGRDPIAEEHERAHAQRMAHQEFVMLQRAAGAAPGRSTRPARRGFHESHTSESSQ